MSPGRATRERPHTDRVITVDPRTPARPTSNTQEAGKTTTEQPSSEEVAVDPGSPTQPQSPAAGKTATEQPSVEEVAADPGSPTGPQSPAAAKTTTEQSRIEEVPVDPGSPTEPQSPAAGKTTTEQPTVEEVAVDPGSPTGPQSPETDQQPRNEGQEGDDLPVAVISPAVERSDIPVSVSWLNIGLGPKSKCFPFGQPLLHRKRLSEWKHARFWLAYLPPTHVMSVRMVSLQALVMGG